MWRPFDSRDERRDHLLQGHGVEAAGRVPRRREELLSKTLLHLDEIGRTLDPKFDPNASVRKKRPRARSLDRRD